MDALTAISSQHLLGRWFDGPSWSGWRTVLKAAYGHPLDDSERQFFRAVAGDREPPKGPVREIVIISGRRSGKDSIASAIASTSAAFFGGQGRLRPGERPMVLCLACDKQQASIVLDYARGYFREVPKLSELVERETAEGFQLRTGVDLVVSRLYNRQSVPEEIMDVK